MPTDKIPAEDGRLLQAPQLGGKRAGQACYRRTGHAEAAGHGNLPAAQAKQRASRLPRDGTSPCGEPPLARSETAACLPATSATWRSIAASSSASTDAVSATPPTAITASTGAPLRPLRKTLAPSRAATRPRRPALRDEILNAAAACTAGVEIQPPELGVAYVGA
jgi:hypothetical protein